MSKPKSSSIFKIEEAFLGLGVCIRDSELRVLYQNEECISRCGSRAASICRGNLVGPQADEKTVHRVLMSNELASNNELIECVIVKNEKHIIAIQVHANQQVVSLLQQLERSELTPAELAVVKLKLCGRSHVEISKQLFISRATVKTHLNNIYAKIPAGLKEEILHVRNEVASP